MIEGETLIMALGQHLITRNYIIHNYTNYLKLHRIIQYNIAKHKENENTALEEAVQSVRVASQWL